MSNKTPSRRTACGSGTVFPCPIFAPQHERHTRAARHECRLAHSGGLHRIRYRGARHVSPGWAMAIWSLVLFVVAELAVGQVVEPLLYGRSSRMADRWFS
ncbi:hypothetical protein F6X37_11665 [Paraburkholderia sp. 31.1]|nr:hypothetical protein [Paraburkholderia sp. 31.1]